MTFDLISGLHVQIQTWHPPLRLCIHAKYYVKSGLTNVIKNNNKTKNMHLFSIQIANYKTSDTVLLLCSACRLIIFHSYLEKQVSMIRKYHIHTLQTNQRHHEKEPRNNNSLRKASEYDQEIPQSHTADQPTAL